MVIILVLLIILPWFLPHKDLAKQIPLTPITTNNPNDESNNNFPFAINSGQINQSLMGNKTITISPVDVNRPKQINEQMLKNKWQLIGLSHAEDG